MVLSSLFLFLMAAAAAQPVPKPVNGWREYPLRDGVISIQPVKWRTDKLLVPVQAGKGLEYKLTMKKGEGLVYNISYGALIDPKLMVVEFHGHTKQVNGVGDLMFYSKTGGSPESGVFTAPWDGIHGWYLKNDSPKDVVVIAGARGLLRARKIASAFRRMAYASRRTTALRQPLNRPASVEMLEQIALRAADPTRSASSTAARSSGDRRAARRRSARGTPDRSRCR